MLDAGQKVPRSRVAMVGDQIHQQLLYKVGIRPERKRKSCYLFLNSIASVSLESTSVHLLFFRLNFQHTQRLSCLPFFKRPLRLSHSLLPSHQPNHSIIGMTLNESSSPTATPTMTTASLRWPISPLPQRKFSFSHHLC